MEEINLVDHPFKRRTAVEIGGEYTNFGYEYFDSPQSVTGFRGYRSDGNGAEGHRDFNVEALAISSIPGVRTVLDVGCAKGFLVKALRALGVDAHGVDVSDYAIQSADTDVRPFLRKTSIQELTTSEKFDLVHVSGVLVYLTISEIKKALRRFHEIARVGVMVKEPILEDIISWYDGGDTSAIDPLRKQELPQSVWDQMIAAAGFDKDSGWYRKRPPLRDPPSVAVGGFRQPLEIGGG